MEVKTVAIAGATGNVGPRFVQSLAEAGFALTILTRARSSTSSPHKEAVVDYESVESLRAALVGVDAVVSALGPIANQDNLITASVKAGVKRFLPSEYGLDYEPAVAQAIPAFADKVKCRQRLVALASDHPSFSYTVLATGLFLDWSLKHDFLFNPMGPVELWDGGDSVFSLTTLKSVGKAVVGILKRPETTRNKVLRVSEVDISQRQLLEAVCEARPSTRQRGTVVVSSDDRYKEALQALESGIPPSPTYWISRIVLKAVLSGIGAKLEPLDNDLLGMRGLTTSEFEAIVKQNVI